jgi:hypothetical protein
MSLPLHFGLPAITRNGKACPLPNCHPDLFQDFQPNANDHVVDLGLQNLFPAETPEPPCQHCTNIWIGYHSYRT